MLTIFSTFPVGLFTLPVENLRDPPTYLWVREVKDWYVDYLATLLLKEDAEDLTAPFMVIASVSPSEFKAQKLNTYEVLNIVCNQHMASAFLPLNFRLAHMLVQNRS